MSNFKMALVELLANEGNYAKLANDPGGETYQGIARNRHPKWEGWPLVDACKVLPNFPKNLAVQTGLSEAVERFYYHTFWEPCQAPALLNQEMAFSIFDFAVNSGLTTSIRLAQLCAGVELDGQMGPKTIEALNKLDPDYFLALFALTKIARYAGLVDRRPESKPFFFGWVKRSLSISKRNV